MEGELMVNGDQPTPDIIADGDQFYSLPAGMHYLYRFDCKYSVGSGIARIVEAYLKQQIRLEEPLSFFKA